MFTAIKNFFKEQNVIIYIRFGKEKIYLVKYPSGLVYDDLAMIAVNRQNKKKTNVSAVGRAVLELPPSDPSVVSTPFSPFNLDPENFVLAEKVVLYLLQKVMHRTALISPRVIIHPNKSYVSEMEEVAYRELALSAGAREVTVYVGERLEPDAFESILEKV